MMLQRIPLLVLLPCFVFSFTSDVLVPRRPGGWISETALFGGAKGGATSLDGKKVTVANVKELLQTADMIFTVPASSLTVKQSQILRRAMPESTTVKVVKNKLMKLALEGSEFEAAGDLLKGANMWFFIQDDISGTIKSYNAFMKENGKLDTHSILGGVLEGQVYDPKGCEAIGKLPSKQELYAQIAGAIKAVPTKVARVIKAPSSKLARAIKLATDENNK